MKSLLQQYKDRLKWITRTAWAIDNEKYNLGYCTFTRFSKKKTSAIKGQYPANLYRGKKKYVS